MWGGAAAWTPTLKVATQKGTRAAMRRSGAHRRDMTFFATLVRLFPLKAQAFFGESVEIYEHINSCHHFSLLVVLEIFSCYFSAAFPLLNTLTEGFPLVNTRDTSSLQIGQYASSKSLHPGIVSLQLISNNAPHFGQVQISTLINPFSMIFPSLAQSNCIYILFRSQWVSSFTKLCSYSAVAAIWETSS